MVDRLEIRQPVSQKLTGTVGFRTPGQRMLDMAIARANRFGPIENRRTQKIIGELTKEGIR